MKGLLSTDAERELDEVPAGSIDRAIDKADRVYLQIHYTDDEGGQVWAHDGYSNRGPGATSGDINNQLLYMSRAEGPDSEEETWQVNIEGEEPRIPVACAGGHADVEATASYGPGDAERVGELYGHMSLEGWPTEEGETPMPEEALERPVEAELRMEFFDRPVSDVAELLQG